jgi:hypothetical protein
MTVHQLPAEAGAYARYLRDLVALLDRGGGWCGIFWQRDPDGMRACLDGTEIPPWDVVESLLQDLAGGRGEEFADAESVRARQIHTAAAAAHDRQPGGREALEERLELMRRERVYATGRAEELVRRLSAEAEGTPAADQLAHELAWTRDDHARATARVAELRSRLTALDADNRSEYGSEYGPGPGPQSDGRSDFAERQTGRQTGRQETQNPAYDGYAHPEVDADAGWARAQEAPEAGTGFPQWPGPVPAREAYVPPETPQMPDGWFRPEPAAPAYEAPPVPSAPPAPPAPREPDPAPVERPAPAAKKRRPRGARFAGVEEDGEEIAAVPLLPVAGDVPRGARYGGGGPAADPEEPAAAPVPDGVRQAAREIVVALGRLRAEGRSGEAHVLLCEAAARPAPWLPLLAAELHRAGLDADWATLLWEAASQPALRLAAAAGALAAAGRVQDSRQLLRQGVARPAEEIAAAVLALEDEGRQAQARALLAAFVQVRTAEDAAAVAEHDPRRLVPQLLAAARAVSVAHERDLVHALRVAGHLGG